MWPEWNDLSNIFRIEFDGKREILPHRHSQVPIYLVLYPIQFQQLQFESENTREDLREESNELFNTP